MSVSNTTNAIISGMLATSVATVTSSDVWRMTAFLCVGTIFGVSWCGLSKQNQEESRMTKARAITGAMSGVFFPRLIESLYNYASPWGTKIRMEAFDPLLLISLGFILSVLGFFITHTILRGVEKDQKKIGDMVSTAATKTIASKLGIDSEEVKRDEDNHTGPPASH